MRYITTLPLLFLGTFCFAQSSPTKWQNLASELKALTEPTVLLGITGVNDLDSEITEPGAAWGGGLELTRTFSTQFYPNLRPCSREVLEAIRKWKVEQNLVSSDLSYNYSEVWADLWPPDYSGLFEVRYQCSEDGTNARSWLNYYTLEGEQIRVETVYELYQTYKISSLWDDLFESMGCVE